MFPAKTKIFAMWLLQKKFANSCFQSEEGSFAPWGHFAPFQNILIVTARGGGVRMLLAVSG